MNAPVPLRIGEVLIAQGLVTAKQVSSALATQRVAGVEMPLGHILAAQGATSLEAIENAVKHARHHNSTQALTPITLTPSVCRAYGIKPLGLRNGDLIVAAVDELDDATITALIRAAEEASDGIPVAGVRVEPYDRRDLLMWINASSGVDIQNIEAELISLVRTREIDGAALNQLIHKIIQYAIDERVSDIHWERNGVIATGISMRQHGEFLRNLPVSERVMTAMMSRVKTIAGMDFSELRRDQDGTLSIEYANRTIHLRISSKPSVNGESMVVRIQDPNNLQSIGALMADHQPVAVRLAALAAGAAKRGAAGLILFTGPTGSGKSTSMAGMLMGMPRHEMKIITVEEPVEILVPMVIHTNTNDALAIDFARGLRSMKRQDVDVTVAGEIRDVDTAQEVFRMAQAGHLTLATLHTDDATGTLSTLLGYFADHPFMPIARAELPGIIRVVVNQRLVPRLCMSCRRPYSPTDQELQVLKGINCTTTMFFRSEGCDRCGGSGIAGQAVVPDALFFPETTEVREHLAVLIQQNALQRAAKVPGVFHYTRNNAFCTLLAFGQVAPSTIVEHLGA